MSRLHMTCKAEPLEKCLALLTKAATIPQHFHARQVWLKRLRNDKTSLIDVPVTPSAIDHAAVALVAFDVVPEGWIRSAWYLVRPIKEFQGLIEQALEDDEAQTLLISPSENAATGGNGTSLEACNSALTSCNVILGELHEQVESMTKPKLDNKLRWPFPSSGIYEKLNTLHREKSTLQLARSTYQTRLLQIRADALGSGRTRKKRAEVLQWYKTSDPEQNQRASVDSHDSNMGAWTFDNEKLRLWRKVPGGEVLWMHGIPGADSNKQSMRNLLKSCNFQLISVQGATSIAAAALYDGKHGGLGEPSLDELRDVLMEEVAGMQHKYLIIDALDECPKAERSVFLEQILGPIQMANFNILITSRKEADIERSLQDLAMTVSIQDSMVDEDIRTHVKSVISRDERLSVMSLAIQEEIMEGIVSGARGIPSRNHHPAQPLFRLLLAAGADESLQSRRNGSALSAAISSRDMTTFRTILEVSSEYNAAGDYFETCFSKAVTFGEFEMAKILLHRDADLGRFTILNAISLYDREPWVLEALLKDEELDVGIFRPHSGSTVTTPLHIAASEKGKQKIVRLLLERKAYVNAIDQKSYTTLLCLAIREGNQETAQLLIDYGADIRRTVTFSPLEMAVKYACDDDGTLKAVDMLLNLGVDINQDTAMANTVVLRNLRDRGMDLNRLMAPPDRPRGGFLYQHPKCTPIRFAAKEGDMDLIKLLLELGGDLNGPYGTEGTTLHYGILSKNRDMVDFLLNNGVKVDDSVEDNSLLHKAIVNELADLIPTLVEKGANVNAEDGGKSPLAAEFKAKNTDVVEFLRTNGPCFLESDAELAKEVIEKGTVEELRTLLECGLHPNSRHTYVSAINIASQKSDTETILLLVQYGARLGEDEGKSALGMACKNGHLNMAVFLIENGAAAHMIYALSLAAGVANNLAIVEMLLDRGADIAWSDAECFNAAGRCGYQKIMTRLLQQLIKSPQRARYLGLALQECRLERWLMETQGAPLDQYGPPYGSPLQAVLSWTGRDINTRVKVIQAMLQRGASVNPPLTYRPSEEIEQQKRTRHSGFQRDLSPTYAPPLTHVLVGRGWSDGGLQRQAQEFLARNADPNGEGGKYHHPLQAAAQYYPRMLGPLLEAGADINAAGGQFGTALHAAAWSGNDEAVRILLSWGADARIIAGKHGSVMQAAARGGNQYGRRNGGDTDILELLLGAGADVHSTAGKYGSAVQMAAARGNLPALQWLVAKGADIRVRGGRHV
ncbi:ankyrin repeat-containing domain protein [Xylariales sp. PMI_506]|nr:ankyrin repeat-containing domain protein [Xylariales sp. PMI_506]